jgi:hypothetical protein
MSPKKSICLGKLPRVGFQQQFAAATQVNVGYSIIVKLPSGHIQNFKMSRK